MKEIAGRGKNASFNFRTGPNPCAYRLYILISSSGLGIGNTKARVFMREAWEAHSLAFLPTWILWSVLLPICMQTHRDFLGPRPCPLKPKTEVPIYEEANILISALTRTVAMEAGRARRRRGSPWMFLLGEKCTNTNINTIYATSTARLLEIKDFPDSETQPRGSYLSFIPEGDPDQGLVLLQHLKYKPQPSDGSKAAN